MQAHQLPKPGAEMVRRQALQKQIEMRPVLPVSLPRQKSAACSDVALLDALSHFQARHDVFRLILIKPHLSGRGPESCLMISHL